MVDIMYTATSFVLNINPKQHNNYKIPFSSYSPHLLGEALFFIYFTPINS